MLRELTISNLALIEKLTLSFGPGLTVFTGETGAGKSIMLQGLRLLFGSRGAGQYIRAGAEQAVVEAAFDLDEGQGDLALLLADNGFEPDGEVILRRQVVVNGKNRCHINATPAPAKLLEDSAEQLLAIASQHEHQRLLEPRRHIDFLDAAAGLLDERRQLAALYTRWQTLKQERAELARRAREDDARRELLRFQVQEIEAAALVAGEDIALAKEKERLKSLEILRKTGGACLDLLEENVTVFLGQVRRQMETLADLDQSALPLAENIADLSYQMEEETTALSRYLDRLPEDDRRLDEVGERLDCLHSLMRKYGDGIEAVNAYGQKAAQELALLNDLEEHGCKLDCDLELARHELAALADRLAVARANAAVLLEEKMTAELTELSFAGARLFVRITDLCRENFDNIRPTGRDMVEFFFSANPGEPEKALSAVASGGELSRLTLAFKCVLATSDLVQTVIFDEVDAGIGGQAAESVAAKICRLAGHHQVICITHLPQIAARGSHHFLVAKNAAEGRTVSTIRPLSFDERVDEISRMLAGDAPTATTRAYALELLGRGSQ